MFVFVSTLLHQRKFGSPLYRYHRYSCPTFGRRFIHHTFGSTHMDKELCYEFICHTHSCKTARYKGKKHALACSLPSSLSYHWIFLIPCTRRPNKFLSNQFSLSPQYPSPVSPPSHCHVWNNGYYWDPIMSYGGLFSSLSNPGSYRCWVLIHVPHNFSAHP